MNQRHLVSYQCLSLVRTWLKWADPFINMENIFLSKPLLHFTFECKFTWSSDCLEMIFHVEKLFGQANKLSAVNKMLANLAGIWTNYLWLWTVALGDLDRRKDKRCFHPECINQFRKNKDIPFFYIQANMILPVTIRDGTILETTERILSCWCDTCWIIDQAKVLTHANFPNRHL